MKSKYETMAIKKLFERRVHRLATCIGRSSSSIAFTYWKASTTEIVDIIIRELIANRHGLHSIYRKLPTGRIIEIDASTDRDARGVSRDELLL